MTYYIDFTEEIEPDNRGLDPATHAVPQLSIAEIGMMLATSGAVTTAWIAGSSPVMT